MKIDRKDWDYPYCKAGDPRCVQLCDCMPPMPLRHKIAIGLGLTAIALWILYGAFLLLLVRR